jgi:hypothetical protein
MKIVALSIVKIVQSVHFLLALLVLKFIIRQQEIVITAEEYLVEKHTFNADGLMIIFALNQRKRR